MTENVIIEVMCRIADGPLRPGQLEVTQTTAPLVSWSVNTRDVSEARDRQAKDLAIELHFPDDTVWTGEAYPVVDGSDDQMPGQPPDPEFPVKLQLRGIGPLSESSIPVHSDVVVARINAMLAERQR